MVQDEKEAMALIIDIENAALDLYKLLLNTGEKKKRSEILAMIQAAGRIGLHSNRLLNLMEKITSEIPPPSKT